MQWASFGCRDRGRDRRPGASRGLSVTARRATERRLAAGLNVAEWAGDAPPIVALHGLTSTYHTWSKVAADFAERRVIAPDLRGRGGSMAMGGPYGLPRHAADVQAMLEELDLRDIVLVGHSMGAFIAPLVARYAKGRVTRMVLLDGGPPVALPFFFVRPLVRMVFQRQAREVAEPFESVPALIEGKFGAAVRDHAEARTATAEWLTASAIGPEGEKRAAVLPEAVSADGVSNFFDREVREAARNLAAPARLLYANWGGKDGARPFYTPQAAAKLEREIPRLRCSRVEGTNHLTLLFAPQVVEAVREA